jgi:hypothetical protein
MVKRAQVEEAMAIIGANNFSTISTYAQAAASPKHRDMRGFGE